MKLFSLTDYKILFTESAVRGPIFEKKKSIKFFYVFNVLVNGSSDAVFKFLRFFVCFVGMYCTDLMHTVRN